jgi:ketosteroid isomerase-like protein
VRIPVLVTVSVIALAGCSASGRPGAADTTASTAARTVTDEAANLAHTHYTDAINSNNIDSLMGMMTDDVVFLAAHSPPMLGRAAVRAWAAAYYDAFNTRWEKDNKEFVVTGDWAFERYNYRSTDTPKAGGKPVMDTGWGLVIYHHDADGKWRVARDAFGTDQPLPKP